MIVVKFMGLLDLLTALAFILLHHGFLGPDIAFYFLIYLGIKMVGFWGDMVSKIDGLCAVYMLLMFLGFQFFLTYIIAIYLGQKALFSLFA